MFLLITLRATRFPQSGMRSGIRKSTYPFPEFLETFMDGLVQLLSQCT